MRSYDESMSVLTSAIERHPGSRLRLEYRRGGWEAVLTLAVMESVGRRLLCSTAARSCEAEKALDALAGKVEQEARR